MLINDRQITISAGSSRRSVSWQRQTLLLSELYERLKTPARGTETMAEYLAMKKPQQDELKDVGGYVAGALSGPRRKVGAVVGRDVLTLDLDNIPAGDTDDVLRRVDGLGCGYCVYSTRKHSPGAPRLRILLPVDRTITADEYEPCTRRMAAYIGIELADPTTFEVHRLMYWPSCCADSQYVYTFADKPLLSADGLLATYADWRDVTEWPQVPGTQQAPQRLAAKQGDPLTKPGVVGAFCRTYDIYRAMDDLLPGVYDPVDNMENRYTFTGGSTTGGAVVYDNGLFLYSHHATDPCSGKLVNAFDLVRLHKFADLDDDAKDGTPTNRMPSYEAMRALAVADPDVAALMSQERYDAAVQDFDGVTADNTDAPANWMAKLKSNPQTGLPAKTMDNVWTILENDHLLKGKFALNEFAGRGEVIGQLPWSKHAERRYWEDNDNQGLYWYLEKAYQITGNAKIDGALSLHSSKHSFNEVKQYISGLQWDGVPRLDTLVIDYLGAEDNIYTRAVTRKAFTAAVARAMTPGIKFDSMTILSGPQGIGKSTLLQKMSKGWFNDSIRTFEGKEASELLQGVWLVEVSELDAFRRTDVSRIKQFLSLRADRFRAAYGRHVKEMPRCCVFFGSTNNREYLQDKTGNRRFWPLDVGLQPVKKDVFNGLDSELDQLWAEAVIRWRLGEPLYLSGEVEAFAKAEQEEHRERSPHEGIILDFLEQRVPADWTRWDLPRRQAFWSGLASGEVETVERDQVCALEVWCEALHQDQRFIKNTDAAEINAVIEAAHGWKRMNKTSRFGYCKVQRGFKKV
jgi:predicted P-loop ATPase